MRIAPSGVGSFGYIVAFTAVFGIFGFTFGLVIGFAIGFTIGFAIGMTLRLIFAAVVFARHIGLFAMLFVHFIKTGEDVLVEAGASVVHQVIYIHATALFMLVLFATHIGSPFVYIYRGSGMANGHTRHALIYNMRIMSKTTKSAADKKTTAWGLPTPLLNHGIM